MRRLLESALVYGVVIAVVGVLAFVALKFGPITARWLGKSDCLEQYVLPPEEETLAAWLVWANVESADEYAYLVSKGKLYFAVSAGGSADAWELCFHGTNPNKPYAEFLEAP